MVGGHKPGIRTGEVSRGQDQTGSATRQEQEQECRNKIQGPGKTHTKAESAGLAIP
ncbi:unnamed protein product [Staurois parvus]|uniref:Uncharacterized protein n=1 Tax=Staurois parvus TaxID=386267 RepID=A0ABN9FQ16_9NEOB|nr:unnamed protein product [Staurois parvus]